MKLCSSQCKVKCLSLSQGSVVPCPWGQCNWNTSKNVLFLFRNEKVFIVNFSQEVNFSSLVIYYHNLFSTSFSKLFQLHMPVLQQHEVVSILLYFIEQTLYNTEALVEIPVIAPYCWPCGFSFDADVFQTLLEHRCYEFPLFSSTFNSFKEQNLACF